MPTLENGAAFGSYTIEGFIARGGMGEVYAARHEVYGSPVAIKVLHPHLDHEEAWRLRFSEEGVVGQQLKHPHILSARELVEDDGRVAIVMDLVAGGQTLHKVLLREFPDGLPLSDALHVFLGIVQGVEYAHGKGIVHGDLKPENVLIQGEFRNSATWLAKVTDFGTVGLLAHPVLIEGQKAVVASPRYASPEHMYGTDALVERSDIYCLGLLLHFLLTGKHASAATDVMDALAFVRAPVPVAALVDLPDAVIELVRRCSAARTEDRIPSCRELALEVRQLLDDLGEGLQLEDLQGDLATEIMEERRRLMEVAALEARDAELPLPDPEDTELAPAKQFEDEIPTDPGLRRDKAEETPAGMRLPAHEGIRPPSEQTTDDSGETEEFERPDLDGPDAVVDLHTIDPPPMEDDAPTAEVERPAERIPGIVWVGAAVGLLVILAILAMTMPH